jgi:divalent metal cation (Fe/Co/Zn/Cd) transporter
MAVRAIAQETGIAVRGLKMIFSVVPVLAKATPATRFIFLEDMAAMFGLIVAGASIIIVHYTGNIFFDGAASIIIGILLLFIGIGTARENASAILGESADPALIREVGDFVMTIPGIIDVHDVRSMCVGPNSYLLEMIVEADERINLVDCDDIRFCVKNMVKERFKEIPFAHISVIGNDKKRQWDMD